MNPSDTGIPQKNAAKRVVMYRYPVGGDWNMTFIFPSELGMLSSQLTSSYFSEGYVYHQPDYRYVYSEVGEIL